MFLIHLSRNPNILSSVDAENITLPLNFTDNVLRSRWFNKAPKHIIDILGTQDVTMNNHVECVTPKDFYGKLFKSAIKLYSKYLFVSVLFHLVYKCGQVNML